ncbi:Membrane protein involved in the export of O-antigen and teichoic acid [Bowdeniella nasicola]|uniref:Membrane protein involved in the export of O-antigen and teichoic acid n=1 Tax=Bowdeniella nasicola TaxID=208480 RepID=A0A1H3VKC2_9ACTO|nr:oligosaccharide flippase family protein [Bowdeniella nasicola]SDZ75121.1 Membrane protein involved in the export of O-antigen and teichoic acid [Bowdeniella nasicola]
MRERWQALTGKYPLLVSITTLLSGTVVAQIISLLSEPIVGRIYTPEQTGIFQSFLVIPLTIAAVAALRYDMAIMLPRDEREARLLLRASLSIIAILGALTSLTTWAFREQIATAMHVPEVARWLPLTGLVVFILGSINAVTFWLNRTVDYGAISRNRVIAAGGLAGSRIGAHYVGLGGTFGLVWSQILAQGAALSLLVYRVREAIFSRSESPTPLSTLLKRYKKMPLLNAPNALIDAFRLNGVIVLLGVAYSSATVGQFSKSWALMMAPVSLISGAISQVFYQKFATAKRGELTKLVRTSVMVALGAGVIPFAILFFITPWLIPTYIGPKWELAGLISQSLIPWLFVMVVTSPISTVFVVVNSQQYMLMFSIAYAIVPIALIYTLGPTLDIVPMVQTLSAAMSVMLILLALLTLWVARRFDHGAQTYLDA